MNYKPLTIFPMEGRWFIITKEHKKSITLRELINYKPGDNELTFGGTFTADKVQQSKAERSK
jgi:hypothetical protein